MDGRCLNAIPRTMLLSKGGESIKGVSIKDRELIEHGARVAESVGIKGPANVQCFREPDGSLPITDVNTRFGGGFPVPLAAGGRYPELALALARGEKPEPRLGDFTEGVAMTRYFSEVCLDARPASGVSPADPAASLAFPWPCATSSPARPASSARSSCARCSSAGTTRPAGTRSRTTTTRR